VCVRECVVCFNIEKLEASNDLNSIWEVIQIWCVVCGSGVRIGLAFSDLNIIGEFIRICCVVAELKVSKYNV
jgi:hypothetical protein